jgi:hypothetical protein
MKWGKRTDGTNQLYIFGESKSSRDSCSGQGHDELDVLCVLCACTVRGQIVVYHVLRSVRVVELAVESNCFYSCSIFRLMIYKKFSKTMRDR